MPSSPLLWSVFSNLARRSAFGMILFDVFRPAILKVLLGALQVIARSVKSAPRLANGVKVEPR
jgi:hypothetical protein